MLKSSNETRFSLSIAGLQHDLQVLEFEGTEGISQVYRFDLKLVSEQPDLDLQTLLHRPAFLSISPGGTGIHGLIYSATHGDPGKRLHRYQIAIVPHLAYLQHRSNHRIFQNLAVPDIITQVLADHAILTNVFQFHTAAEYPPRDYCVQYGENDLHFIQRLCEEEGIHFHFRHSADGHSLIFGDDQTVFPRLAEPTPYRQDSGMVADEPVINAFNLRLETRTTRTARRDYNFEKPRLQLDVAQRPKTEVPGPDLEDYSYPGGFTFNERGQILNRRHLERHRSDYQQASGHSDQSTLRSGHCLQMVRHPCSEWNDLWLLTKIKHKGKQPQVLEESSTGDVRHSADDFQQGYRNEFQATPWDVYFRPGLNHRKPVVLGSQTAFVSGPEGEEIHCDEYGRVKVQFHWDREGQRNDHSSCWLRVASSWAGNRYGAVVIPRVNMEVLVTFLEGDPDQPVISGCLYHRENEVPYALPANKTRTTFKTLSSPGGGGYNELRLEDRKGMEQIFIHAERNFDLDIGHDQRIHVGNERHDKVEGDSYSEFMAEEHRTTHGARKIEVKGDDHLDVSQTQHIRLGTAQLVQAGKEIHLKAGEKIVIDAGLEITLQAGGNFLKVDCGGLTASQLILPGGAPGAGSAAAILAPMLPLPTVKDMVGNLLVKGPMNAPLERGGMGVGGVASVSAVGLPLQSQSQSQSRQPGGLLVASE